MTLKITFKNILERKLVKMEAMSKMMTSSLVKKIISLEKSSELEKSAAKM